MKIRIDTSIWFRDVEVLRMRNEKAIVDAGRWLRLCVIDLRDELNELEERLRNAGGALILPGLEDDNNVVGTDEQYGEGILSYMRVFINFVDLEEEQMSMSFVTISKWAVRLVHVAAWTFLGFALLE